MPGSFWLNYLPGRTDDRWVIVYQRGWAGSGADYEKRIECNFCQTPYFNTEAEPPPQLVPNPIPREEYTSMLKQASKSVGDNFNQCKGGVIGLFVFGVLSPHLARPLLADADRSAESKEADVGLMIAPMIFSLFCIGSAVSIIFRNHAKLKAKSEYHGGRGRTL